MKKLLYFAALAVAITGFGMHMGTAHAQTTDNAALQQQLDAAKATLVNLEMQEGLIPRGDDQLGTATSTQPVSVAQPAPTASGIAPSEITYFNGVLSQLTNSLQQLAATVSANPTMTSDQTASIAATLGGMKGTLLSMATQIAQDENNSPVAIATPSTGTVAGAATAAPSQVAQTPAATKPAPSAAQIAAAAAALTSPANNIQATAQASSIWSFTKTNWPVIVIILLVIAILAILFWPENEAKAPAKATNFVPTPKVTASMTPGAGMSAVPASAPVPMDTTTRKAA